MGEAAGEEMCVWVKLRVKKMLHPKRQQLSMMVTEPGQQRAAA
jgi:hypothetical protein